MGNLTHTVSGDIASFRSAARVPIESLKCHFKPKQDFNGYDRPWPAGGGKNLFNINAPQQNPDNIDGTNQSKRIFTPNTYFIGSSYSNYWNTSNVSSYSINNNSITVDARAGYGVGFAIQVIPGNYFLSNTNTGGGITNVTLYEIDGTAIILESGGGLNNINVPEGVNIMVITFRNKTFGTPVTFSNIQLERGTFATSYEPYENICPIEGWDNINTYAITGDYKIDYIPGTTLSYNVTFVADGKGFVTASGTPTSYSTCYYGYIDVDGTETIYGTIFGSLNNITWNKPTLYNSSGYEINTSLGDGVLNNGLDLSQFSGVTRVRIVLKRNMNNVFMSGYCSVVIGKNRKIVPDTLPITFPTTGKNKFFYDTSNYTLEQITTGQGTLVDRYIYHTGLYGGTYTMSASIIDENERINENYNLFNYGYMKNKQISIINTFINTTTEYTRTITVAKDEEIVLISTSDNSYTTNRWMQKYNIQIECGDTATTYELYSTEHTYYGGYVDLIKGELVAEWEQHIFDGTESILTMNYRTSDKIFTIMHETNCAYGANGGIVCNMLQTLNSHGKNLCYQRPSDPGYLMDFDRNIICNLSTEDFDNLSNAEQLQLLKDYLADLYANNTPLITAYKLITPIHIPISTNQLNTYLDRNNYWSNTNDITEVSYQIHDSNMIQSIKKSMMKHIYVLPPEYQKCDYLQTSGHNTRINTGISGDDNTLEFDCTYMVITRQNYAGIFGNYQNEDTRCWRIIQINSATSGYLYQFWLTAYKNKAGASSRISVVASTNDYVNKKIHFHLKNGNCTSECDGYTASTNTGDYTNTNSFTVNSIAIGASSPTATGGTGVSRFYNHFKIWSHEILIRDYIPCYRKSDNKAGFYDLINHTFNPSIGSAEFIAGND